VEACLGASDLLPEAHERNPRITSLSLGVVLIFAAINVLNIGF
jgi:hypothetical protein